MTSKRLVGGSCPKVVRATYGARDISTSCWFINQMLAECSSNARKIEVPGASRTRPPRTVGNPAFGSMSRPLLTPFKKVQGELIHDFRNGVARESLRREFGTKRCVAGS